MNKKEIKSRDSLVTIAIFIWFTIGIYAPFELYWGNQNEMWFDLSMFWWIPLLVGTICITLTILLGLLFKNSFQSLYQALLFAAGIGIYLQGNFLNLKINVLNGAAIQWSEYRIHIFVDMLIWVFILVAVLFLALQKRELFSKIAFYVSLFLTSIQFISLLFMLTPIIVDAPKNSNQSNYVSDKELYQVGDENVVVFILDMFDDSYMKELLADEPELEEQLDGFTYFSNFSGSYSTTTYSIAHLATGKTFHNEEPVGDWAQNVTKEGSYLENLLQDGFKVYLYTDFYQYFPEKVKKEIMNSCHEPLKLSSNKTFAVNLYQLVACKYLPDFLKAYIWMDGTEFDTLKATKSGELPYNDQNTIFMEQMQKKGMQIESGTKQFKFIHLNGVHYPYYNNEKCQKVARDSVSAEKCARGALQCVLDYMDLLKQNGVYENTSIIITADHGYYWDGTLTSPVFLVKPMHTTGKLTINSAPASQTDFGATVLTLAGLNTKDYGNSVFDIKEDRNRERYFYQYYLNENGPDSRYRLIEYKVDDTGNTKEHFHLTDVEYTVSGEKIEHSKYCKTCKGKDTPQSNPDIVVHHKDTNYPE